MYVIRLGLLRVGLTLGVDVQATKATEEVSYLGGETRVKGLIQSVLNKNPSALGGCAIFAKIGGDWEATALDEQAFISSLDFTEEVRTLTAEIWLALIARLAAPSLRVERHRTGRLLYPHTAVTRCGR